MDLFSKVHNKVVGGAHKITHAMSRMAFKIDDVHAAKNVVVLTVDAKGTAQFQKVQQAVDAASSSSSTKTLIKIASGVYSEKVYVPKEKSNLIFQGEGYGNTVIQWGDTHKSAGGTEKSASVTIKAPNFTAYDISFKNTSPAPPPSSLVDQAVALIIEAERGAFFRCGFYGAQDTLYDKQGNHYFEDCLIQGTVDFIFGHGKSLYKGCAINSVVAQGGNGYITAHQKKSNTEDSGYSFVDCTVEGSGKIMLGRPWAPYAKVIFCRTSMSGVVDPQGWADQDIASGNSDTKTVFFGEFMNTGAGANTASRVAFAKQLTPTEAAPFLDVSYIADGTNWIPPAHPPSASGHILSAL